MNEITKLTERIASRRPIVEDDPDAFEDCGAFGLLRGVRDRALMLDFRLKNGNREALPYSLLERVSCDPSDGLRLRYLGVTVTLRGRNLIKPATAGVVLFDAILRHRVPWIAEVEEVRSELLPSDAVQVTHIEIRDGK